MKSELTVTLSKELAGDLPIGTVDLGIRAGVDPLHPLYRSQVVTSFASWNLLDLHDHKEITLATVKAIEDRSSSNSSTGRFVGGLSVYHGTCEARLASFFGAESGILFATRNQAILTLVTALSKEGAVVIGPAMSALPIADACALVELDYGEFDGLEDLRKLLECHRSAKRLIVVAEAVSATTGRRLDSTMFISLAEQYGAWVVIDESAAVAHSGLRGAGSAENNLTSPVLLARLCGCNALAGADIAALVGPVELRELLLHRSRYIRVEPPPPAPLVAAVSSGVDLIEIAITQRDKLLVRSKMVQSAVRTQGWSVVSNDDVPIVSIWLETLAKARELQEGLLQRGSVVEALVARSVRKNGAVVRALLSSGHTELEVSRLLEGLLEIRKRMTA